MSESEIEEVIKGLGVQAGSVCVRCGERKPLTDFYCRPDGYHFTRCKKCERKHRNEHNRDRDAYLAKKAQGWRRVRCGKKVEWSVCPQASYGESV